MWPSPVPQTWTRVLGVSQDWALLAGRLWRRKKGRLRSPGSPLLPADTEVCKLLSPFTRSQPPCGLTVSPRRMFRRPGSGPDVRGGVCSHTEGSLPALGVLPCPVAGVHSGGSWAQDWAAGHQHTGSFLPRAVSGGSQASRVHTGPVVSSSRVWALLQPGAPGGRLLEGVGWRRLSALPPPPSLMPAPSKGSPCSVASSCLLS